MKRFHIRILSFFYWFYILESDSWMRLYYALAAFSCLIMCYVSGVMHALGSVYNVDDLLFNTVKDFTLYILVLTFNFLIVFSNQRSIEKSIKESLPMTKDFSFYLIIILILGGIISFFGSVIYFDK